MGEFIEIISEIRPINNLQFAIADVNDLRGGYIQVDTIEEMMAFLDTNKLKEGMLCYVKNYQEYNMFQYKNGSWNPWVVDGSGSSAVKVVDKMEDLDDIQFKIKGQIVFVNEINDIRYYNGVHWNSFSKIYIQPIPPEDHGGIWIDTSNKRENVSENTVIKDLLQVIHILENKVSTLEFLVRDQLDFGSFNNNKIYEFAGKTGINPDDNEYFLGTSVEEDNRIQKENIESGIIEIVPTDFEYAGALCIKSGTYDEMIFHKNAFRPKELLFCHDKNQLWIKHPITFELIQIGSGEGTGPEPPIEDKMEGILTEIIGSGSNAKTKIVGIEMADMTNKENSFRIQVLNGKLDVRDIRLDKNILAGNTQTATSGNYFGTPYFPIIPAKVGSVDSPKIYVNSVYCGAESNKYSYNPVSHNFVELCNLGLEDLNLKGLFLHYTEKNTGDWVTLPLTGVIKSQGTFLIKGAQSSVENINTTVIKVGNPDLYWTKASTKNATRLDVEENVESGIKASTIWDENDLIRFNTNCAFMITGAETNDYFDTNILNVTAPWNKANGVIKWYVDCVGLGKFNETPMPAEGTAFATTGLNVLLTRYFNMDPVKQATKALSARSNATDWTYINLSKINPAINITDYIPKASFENKTVFFNKTLLKEGAPNIVTCTFGYNAHTTRCFTWLSVGYYDEYIKIWKDGQNESQAEIIESFKEGDSRTSNKNWNNKIYNRIRSITTDGTPFTTHKLIKDFEEPTTTQKYFYKVGREGAWTETRSFVLRNRQKCITDGYNFMQFSDQQGFNNEEYEMARVSNEFIENDKTNNSFDFIINVGDMTQNGNRINEWLSYFQAGDHMFNTREQMFTIGNNDLCPLDVYVLGMGDEKDKTNPVNAEYFFTFEHPYTIPTSAAGVYVPCVYSFIYGNTYYLSMNSEITELARTDLFLDSDGQNVYTKLQEWSTQDLTHIDSNIEWKVAYCHESPFTIITADLIMSYIKDGVKNPAIKRGGSHLNTVGNYWFSQFLQDNGFKLCMCGHKHTYSNTRYLREDITKTMEPIIYEPLLTEAPWYKTLPDREKQCCQLSSDNSLNFVRYVMTQACGYKLVSNKELPAQNIPWLQEYYPVTSQKEDPTTNKATVTANPEQLFPNYIIWNIGNGTEAENPLNSSTSRSRIKGQSFKLKKTGDSNKWVYKYNVPISYTDLSREGGNGSKNPNYNIIIEKQLQA